MGFQSDIYLGWVGKDDICKAMGDDFYTKFHPSGGAEYDRGGHFIELDRSKPAILEYLNGKHGFTPSRVDESAFVVPEMFEWSYEGDDVGDDCHILGVQLTGRYFPKFLDFESEHGGLYVKRFTGALLDDIEWFRNHLITEYGLAHYASAEAFTKDNWY